MKISINLTNKEQQKAIRYNLGPLLIIAGAGTGKTFSIVEKIKYLIQKKLAKPEEILALTFTEKAAFEMEERVDKMLPYGYFQMWISTFHSFADQVLKEEIIHIGLSPNYQLLTQAETIIFIRNNLFLFNLKYFRPLSNPHKFLEGLLQHFTRLKDEDISPEEYLKWIENRGSRIEDRKKQLELAHAYKKFQDLKIKENVMDFSNLIFFLLKLFRQRKNILRKYQQKFKYVLIDEFQDTNIAQYVLIKLLCPPKQNPKLTVVGDDSQAIYKFRGASVSNILTFMKDYPSAKQITLKKNYRSNQEILDAAYRLIKNNDPDTLEAKLGISKKLIAVKNSISIINNQSSINFYLADKVEEEADFVAKEILKLKKNYNYSHLAVLVRANNHADPFIRSFWRYGIPYQFLGPAMLFKQPEVKDLIAYLYFVSDLEDSVSLYRVLSMNIFNLDKKDISLLLSLAKKLNLPFFQAIETYLSFYFSELYQKEFAIYKPYLPFLREETRQKLFLFYKMVKRHLKLLRTETAGQILYYFLEDSGYLSQLVAYKTEKEERISLNISKFFSKLKDYETQHEDASVMTIVDYIKMSMELGESPVAAETDAISYDAVNVLTIHSAKGLEFPVVFLVNLTKGRFPTYERREPIPVPDELVKEILPSGDYHIEEERRLFYVGMTRAMDKVYFSASNFYYEGKRERKLSPFVSEALGENFVTQQQEIKKTEKNQLSIFDFKKQEEKIVKQKNKIINFSFSQLETFLTCPLQYKYHYVLKIPTTLSSATSFGKTIHKTLQIFYREYLHNKKIQFSKMMEIYSQNWIPIGYSSSRFQQRMKKEGENMLKNFYEISHKSTIVVIDLEKFFKLKIADDFLITGKIDRVDLKENGNIEIIDYKTGKKPDEKELKNSLQLSIYALAAMSGGLYNKKINQIILTFYYLQSVEKVSVKRTEDEVNRVKNQIKQIVKEIRISDFFPNVGPWCDFCQFRMICEAWQ